MAKIGQKSRKIDIFGQKKPFFREFWPILAFLEGRQALSHVSWVIFGHFERFFELEMRSKWPKISQKWPKN